MPLTEQQQHAVESIMHHVLVSAGAGSGKTMVLVERFLRILKEHQNAAISDVIAVTFTRKAAEEMRARLKARLKDLQDTSSGDEQLSWARHFNDVDSARIGTIHSLCESILKAFPAEAGVDPQFEILGDLQRAELVHESVESVLQAALIAPDGRFEPVLDYPIEYIRSWVIPQLASAPQYREARARLGDATVEQIRAHAEELLESLRARALAEIAKDEELHSIYSYLQNNPWPDEKNNLELRRREVLSMLHKILSDKESESETGMLLQELSTLPSLATSGGKNGKPLRDVISAARTRARDILDRFPRAIDETDEAAFLVTSLLLELIDKSIAHYQTLKQRHQALDYNDLIECTANLLANNENVRTQLGTTLRAVLVDEFQDTNKTQARLVANLIGSQSRLFLIGDDKQSIYKFQGADVATFNEWKQILTDAVKYPQYQGKLLELTHSFRSHPSIVSFVNTLFRKFFDSPSDNSAPHKARHQSLKASREDPHDPSRVEMVLFDPLPQEQRDGEAAKALEGRCIAAWIQRKINDGVKIFDKEANEERPISYGDFAVLVQANSNFSSIEAALAETGIPYVTFAGSGFLDRQEVYDLENMLRWLSAPDDSHALLAVLRAPFFAIPDDVIHKIAFNKRTPLWRLCLKAVKQPGFECLIRPVNILSDLLYNVNDLPLGELIRRIIQRTSYDVILLAIPNGKQRSRNVWKFVNLAEEYKHMSPIEFVHALATMRELGVSNQSDAPLASENAVKLMTIHKSKGLEFPAVILPAMGRKVHRVTPKLLLHKDFGIAFDTSRSKEDPRPNFFKAVSQLHRDMEEAEKKRLLYVAMTRARDFMGVFMERNVNSYESFRTWIMNGLQIDKEDGPCADGEYEFQEGAEHAGFSMVTLTPENLSEFCPNLIQSTAQLGLNIAMAMPHQMSLSLLEAIPGAEDGPRRLPVAWQELVRVTPSGNDTELHATILGTYFHALMQRLPEPAAPLSEDVLTTVAMAPEFKIYQKQMQEHLIENGKKLLHIFYKSELFHLLSNARERFHEAPYAVFEEGDVLDRRVDLIFEDAAGQWHIVDYKTDVLSQDQVKMKVREHRPQVVEYINHFEKLTGIRAQGWLYFAQQGTLERVDAPLVVTSATGQLKFILQ